MKKIISLALIALLPLTLFAKEPIATLSGKVVKVSDGDTVTILDSEKVQHKIRLYGIDTPEKKQDFGEAAREHLANLIAGKEVYVLVYDIDRYGRNVGVIQYETAIINAIMLKDGYAWLYEQYCKKPFCKSWQGLEEAAKLAKLGLWQNPESVPPWEWRRKK